MKKTIFYILLCLSCILTVSCNKWSIAKTARQEQPLSVAISPDSGLEEILRMRGFTPEEIDLFLKMPQQLSNVRLSDEPYVLDVGGHFCLDGHDDGQTGQNCGLFAVIRLLYVLGQNGVVDKDLWYRYTIQQLRDIMVDTLEAKEEHRNQGHGIGPVELKNLMKYIGIPDQYSRVVRKGDYWHNEAQLSINALKKELEFLEDLLTRGVGKNVLEGRIDEGYYDPLDKMSLYDMLDKTAEDNNYQKKFIQILLDLNINDLNLRNYDKINDENFLLAGRLSGQL
jgi:hypothetical protein